MILYCGCSGFSYKEWKGHFYPERIKNDEMLAYYAARLDAVEINNTFYRMPKASVLVGWAEKVPAGFRFAVKASRRITHQGRLEDTADSVQFLWKNVQSLGDRLGPLLFQLPPYLRRDDERLARFLAELPAGLRPVLEFRHRSWFAPEVLRLLANHGAALCHTDSEEDGSDSDLQTPLERTADFGYLRLRRATYTAQELSGWRDRIEAMGWDQSYVFFKHEEQGAAAKLARQMAGCPENGNDRLPLSE